MKKEIVQKPGTTKTTRRQWAMRLTAALLIPFSFLLVAEMALRLAGYGFSNRFYLRSASGTNFTLNENFLRQFYRGHAAEGKSVPFRISAQKPAGTVRLFVLGESAAQGTPEPAYGFARILEFMLQAQWPQQRVEVINAALRGVNSHILVPVARDCAELQPDLFLIYAGNNEVVGMHAPGPESTILDRKRILIRATQWLKSLKLSQWIATRQERSRKPEVEQNMDFFRARRVAFDDPRRLEVYQNFQANLEDICAVARRAGAPVILSTVPVNQRDFPPLGSLHREGLAATDLSRWERAVAEGSSAEAAQKFERALEHYLEAARTDDHFAELHFRLARCYLALDRREEARGHFALARDRDALAFRADHEINDAIRATAGGRSKPVARDGVQLVDMEKDFALSSLSPEGIPGEQLFHDNVHLRFEGDYLIAQTLLPVVLSALGKSTTNLPPSRAVCAAALAFTPWDELEIDAGVTASANLPPYLDQLDHAQHQARAEQSIQARRQQFRAEDLQKTIAAHTLAIANRPTDWALRQLLAGLAMSLRDYKLAAENYAFEVDHFPDRFSSRMTYAQALLQSGRPREAVEQLNEALRISPGNEIATKTIAALYSRGSLRPR